MNSLLLLGLVALAAFLVGGVPFGFLVARWRGVDIFAAGSGNIGATNVGRVLGRRFGILVFLLDFAKGALPVAAARALAPAAVDLPPSALPVAAGLCAFLGHLYPPYLRFRGGKGVATGAGAVAMLLPLPALGAILVWLTFLAAFRYVSLASVAAALALCVLHLALAPSPFEGDGVILTSFCLLTAALVLLRHRANLARLLHGNENRLRDNAAMQLFAKMLHVLALGLWFGSAVFFSFVVAPSLFNSFESVAEQPAKERPLWFPLPAEYDVKPDVTRKEQGSRAAGYAISLMFDYYFLLQGICGFVVAITALGWSRSDPTSRVHKARAWVALFALGTVVAGWPIEREVSQLRVLRNRTGDQWMKGERAAQAGRKPPADHDETAKLREEVRAEFGRLHLYSLLLNMLTVLLVTAVMAMAARLPGPTAAPTG